MSQSTTAEFMALFRALESSRPAAERLFTDPLAERFLRPGLALVLRAARVPLGRRLVLAAIDHLWPGARASGVARTCLIDDALSDAIGSGIDQVVVLGAGFDCRAHRLPRSSEARFFEVDRVETLERKRQVVGENPRVRYAPCDFSEDALPECLARAGFDQNRPAFFLWEGVTNYLDEAAVDGVLRYVSASRPGSLLLFTYVDRLAIDQPHRYVGTGRLRATLLHVSEPWTFGLDPERVRDFLKARGLRLLSDVASLDYRARYLGTNGRHLRGYEFYRAALVAVGESTRPPGPDGGS